jgi:hypothetical protein
MVVGNAVVRTDSRVAVILRLAEIAAVHGRLEAARQFGKIVVTG